MALYDLLRDLPIEVDSYRLLPLVQETPGFTRETTVVELAGGGVVGRGEDVSYVPADQAAHRALTALPLSGRLSLAAWSARLDAIGLVPEAPAQHAAADYRRWAWESALVDLGLRQAGRSLGAALERTPHPVRFCVSSTLPQADWLGAYPDTEFKINADGAWGDDDVHAAVASGRVRVIDVKALYGADAPMFELPDPAGLTARIARIATDVVIEDPPLDEASLAALDGHWGRVAFDAPVHSLADIHALPLTGWMNIKPSRFATWERLLAAWEHCAAEGIRMYGGGQFELGPGRPQIQELASLLYADGPNDVAPGAYNATAIGPGLPTSPLPAVQAFGA